MANMVRAMCTAMSRGARWLNAGTLTGLIFIRSAILSMRRGCARFLASVGALPLMGQQFLDSTIQLRRQNTTNLGASSPLPEGGKSLRIPIERTSNGLRLFVDAHVKR